MTLTDIKTASFIAFKTITKGSKSTMVLTIAILSLAFFNLLFITGFLAGFSDGILRSMIDTTTSHIIVMPRESPSRKNFIFNQDIVRKQIETIPGVIATSRHYLLGGSVAYDKDKTGSLKYVSTPIVGINEADEMKVLKVHESMVAGEFPNDLKDDEVVIGANLAGGFDTVQTSDLGGAKVGDKVHIVYANGIDKIYTIKGIFKVTLGMVANNAFISDREAERVLSTHNEASEIMMRVDLKKHTLDEYVNKIKTIAPELTVEKYTKRLAAIGILIDSFNMISFIVSIITIAVSTATIFVMIYINAVSKKKQIGILKAIGIKESIIELSYIMQSLFYAFLGVLFGSMMVFLGAIPFLKGNPIEMPYGNATLVLDLKGVIIYALITIIAAVFAGLVPSRMVARQGIIKAIWG